MSFPAQVLCSLSFKLYYVNNPHDDVIGELDYSVAGEHPICLLATRDGEVPLHTGRATALARRVSRLFLTFGGHSLPPSLNNKQVDAS